MLRVGEYTAASTPNSSVIKCFWFNNESFLAAAIAISDALYADREAAKTAYDTAVTAATATPIAISAARTTIGCYLLATAELTALSDSDTANNGKAIWLGMGFGTSTTMESHIGIIGGLINHDGATDTGSQVGFCVQG